MEAIFYILPQNIYVCYLIVNFNLTPYLNILIIKVSFARHGKKESMNLGDEADYSVEYTANDLYGTASPKTCL